jgi:hypothetical protein
MTSSEVLEFEALRRLPGHYIQSALGRAETRSRRGHDRPRANRIDARRRYRGARFRAHGAVAADAEKRRGASARELPQLGTVDQESPK